jgi:hypothetical protein
MLGTHRGGMPRLTDLEQIIGAPVVSRRGDLLEADSSDLRSQCPLLGALELLVAEDPAIPQGLELGDVVVW